MSADLFRTVVSIPSSDKKLSYKRYSLMMGSCFTQNIGEKLLWYKLPAILNPFGISYNPLSLKKSLEKLLSSNLYSTDELNFLNGQYFSFDHHSKFSDVDKKVCLQNINSSLQQAREVLNKASFLFLTFGSAYYYILNSTKQVVANCHKHPDKDFTRSRLRVDEIVNEYMQIISLLLHTNPNLQIVFTVSPVRHWKDGVHQNQISKSILLLAIDELTEAFENVSYFPAYELMMDELRDYRFYNEDMLHPNKTAIDFIWSRFMDCFIEKETLSIMKEVEKIQLSKQHRPFNTETEEFKKFINQQLFKIETLTSQYPDLDLSDEYKHFKNFLPKK